MGPTAILDTLSGAFRGKDGKVPEYFSVLADAKGTRASSDAWLSTASAALRGGEVERCKGILEAFLEADHKHAGANLMLSRACVLLGSEDDLDDAVGAARAALHYASTPEDVGTATTQLAVALGTRARLHTRQQLDRQKDRSEAIHLLTQLAWPTPAQPPATPPRSAAYTLGVLQAEAGQAAAALATARGALKASQAAAAAAGGGGGPGGGEAAQLTALCVALVAALVSSKQQHKLALSVLSAAPGSAAASSSSPASSSSVPLWTDVLVGRMRARLLGSTLDATGVLAALAGCKKALAGWVEGRAPLPAGVSKGAAEEALAQVWCELAVAFAASGQRAEALAAADHARALRPWAASSCCALGAVHEALGNAAAAAAAYGDALALDPSHGPTLLRQGALHARRGGRADLAVARELLAEALRHDPTAARAWYQLGRVAAALGHRADAEAHLLTAVQLAAAAPALPYDELPLEPPHAE